MKFLLNVISHRSYSTERCLNIVKLLGKVVSDPEAIDSSSGSSGASGAGKPGILFKFNTNSIVSRNKVTKETKYTTDTHNVCVFSSDLQTMVQNEVSMGDRLLIDGVLQYNVLKRDDGKENVIPSIVAKKLILVSQNNSE